MKDSPHIIYTVGETFTKGFQYPHRYYTIPPILPRKVSRLIYIADVFIQERYSIFKFVGDIL